MNSIKRRIAMLEDEAERLQGPLNVVGIVGDRESEKQYQEYLVSGIRKPFIWLETGIRREVD
jgi:hypothetical protein